MNPFTILPINMLRFYDSPCSSMQHWRDFNLGGVKMGTIKSQLQEEVVVVNSIQYVYCTSRQSHAPQRW